MEHSRITRFSNSEAFQPQESSDFALISENDSNLTKNSQFSDPPYQNNLEVSHLSEQQEIINHQATHHNKKWDIKELKINPELYHKMLIEAIMLENEKIKPSTYRLQFRIHYKTLFEEKLVIVGSEEFLGDWNPEKGLELEWKIGDFWEISLLMGEGELPEFEYKYVCLKRNTALWENGANRRFRMEDGAKKGTTLVFNKEDRWQK